MKKIFDYIIITVANQFQKKILESKLMEIKKELSCDTEYIITIEKEKLGSGGALLKIINQVETNKKKILLINSAGKSTRMPIYADKGKIFIPTFSGNNKILLDEIFEEVMPIGERMEPGILIVSGDCTTIYKKINQKVFKENTAFSVLTDAVQGERHGVFVTQNRKLKESLQKESIEVLKEKNAVNKEGKVNIDTGIIYYNEDTVESLKKIELNNVMINLYTDLIYPLCLKADFNEYLCQKSEAEITKELIHIRKEIWNLIKNKAIEIENLENGRFIHYGTTQEFLKIAFERNNNENIVINSVVEGKLTTKCYIENSIISSKSKIGKNSVVIDSVIDCNVPENVLVKTLEISGKYYTIVCDLNDSNRCIFDEKTHLLYNEKDIASKKSIESY